MNTKNDDLDEYWFLEAQRRAKELDDSTVQPIPAEEIRQKAQALLDELLISSSIAAKEKTKYKP